MKDKKMYNMDQAAWFLGISHTKLRYSVEREELPSPDVTFGKRKLFSEKLLNKIKKTLEEDGKKFNHSKSARYLQCSAHTLNQLIKNKMVEEPEKRGNRFFYTQKQLDKMKKIVKKFHANPINHQDLHKEKRTAMGYFSQRQVLEMVDVCQPSLYYNIAKKRIPAPNHSVEGFWGKFYTSDEVEEIKEFYANRTYKTRPKNKETNE